jgi:hypothetical protein
MRKILFLFCLLPLVLEAQKPDWDSAYVKSFRSGFGQPLAMPEIDYNSSFTIEDQFSPRQRQMHYPIATDSALRKIYYRYIYTADSINKYEKNGADSFTLKLIKKYQRDSIPSFDFAQYYLIIYSACAQCLANCNHGRGQESCHRNACNFRHTWFKVRKPRKLQWD